MATATPALMSTTAAAPMARVELLLRFVVKYMSLSL
jgi:hypothetical protein